VRSATPDPGSPGGTARDTKGPRPVIVLAMYRDPDEPTSEPYRLMPPRRPRSELREALDAALHAPGQDQAAAADGGQVSSARRPALTRTASRRILRWLGTVVTGVLIAVLAALIANYLSGARPASSPPHRSPATPAAIVSSRP